MLTRNNIRKGMTVCFTASNAFPIQVEQAAKRLETGEVYRIASIFEDKWGAYLYLDGIPDRSYTCTMFEHSEGDPVVPEAPPSRAGAVRRVVAPT